MLSPFVNRLNTASRLAYRRPLAHRMHPLRKYLSNTSGPTASKTQGIGTGKAAPGVFIKDRGPVSWPSLLLVGIAAASCVAYYNIERERRLETAMGRVVSSESGGWSPNPEVMAPRKFKLTPWGWFPEDDGFGACKWFVDTYGRANKTTIFPGVSIMNHARGGRFLLRH
jgi:hypothetical protein